MGSPYTNIYAIPWDRFESFDDHLKSVKEARTMAAWHSFFEHFDYYPADTVRELAERAGMADGVEPDWHNEVLVSNLKGALVKGCTYVGTEPDLIQDMWESRNPYQTIRLLHEACASPDEHLQACLFRLLLLDRYMLDMALENCEPGSLPVPLSRKHQWCKWFLETRQFYGDTDNINRETASRVVFRYRYPCCLLSSIADESILSPDQVGELAPACNEGGILERLLHSLPPETRCGRFDLPRIAEFIRRLAEPYPYLYSIAYGT